MKYRFLGSSGLLVSRLSLGTMTFGTDNWGCGEKESHDILKAFIDAGGNFIDCANVYAGGRSEEIIGYFLPQVERDDLVITSKCYFPMGQKPNQYGLSRKHVMASCEASLKRLRTDYIDIFYIHGPDPITPYEETLRALDDLVRQGKVRYLGCSNMFGWQVAKAAGVASRMGFEPLTAGQYIYGLIHRELEKELIPAAVDHGIGLTCYGALGAGLLTGKYKGMAEPAAGQPPLLPNPGGWPALLERAGLQNRRDRRAGVTGVRDLHGQARHRLAARPEIRQFGHFRGSGS